MSAARLSSSLAALSRAAARTARTAPRRASLRLAPSPRFPLSTQRFSSSSASASASASAPASESPSTSALTPPPPPHLSAAELSIYTTLAAALSPTSLAVQDISGGCGSMFGIEVASARFAGKGVLAQQRMVNALLKPQMEAEDWHGVQIRTSVA